MSPETRQAFRDAIRRHVCSVCLDQADDGSCARRGRVCGIDRHLPALIDAIAAVNSNRMDEYVAAVESQICSACEQDAGGRCNVRDRGDCALYMYLSLVVDAIEEVKEARPGR